VGIGGAVVVVVVGAVVVVVVVVVEGGGVVVDGMMHSRPGKTDGESGFPDQSGKSDILC
jgi:hypothetical protein